MIYESYNFVDSYSNASGNRKNSMVLGELGKVINKEPKAVKDALKDAGVKVPVNASRRDLVRLIIANKRNKNLIQNLSVLITASVTSKDSFLNLTKEEEEKDELLKPLPATAGGKLTNPNAPKELAGTNFLQKIGSFFQKRKADKKLDSTKKSSAEEQTSWQRFSAWFKKNRGTISQVGNTLYTSLDNANPNNIPTGSGGDGGNSGAGADQTWIQKNKVLVLVGLVVVGGGIYFFSKSKGKSN